MKKLFSALLILGILLTSTVTAFATTAGDVNSDGKINSGDALGILKYAVGMSPKDFNKNVADINNDKKINSSDALVVLQISVGLIKPNGDSNKTTLRDEVIGKVVNDKKFTLSLTVIGEGEKIPTTITMDGDNFATAMSLDGINTRVITKGRKTYIAFDYLGTKMYMEADGDEMGVGDLMNAGSNNDTYVKTTTVKEGSKTYTCEEYRSADGVVTKYYFEGKKWVRQEVIEGDTVSICEIHELRDSVDKSLFDLTGYTKLEEDAFEQLG